MAADGLRAQTATVRRVLTVGAMARYLVAGLAMALVLALWRLDHVSTSLAAATQRVSELETANASRRATQKLLTQLDTDNTKVLTLSLIHI